jgi:hypothetical protein
MLTIVKTYNSKLKSWTWWSTSEPELPDWQRQECNGMRPTWAKNTCPYLENEK